MTLGAAPMPRIAPVAAPEQLPIWQVAVEPCACGGYIIAESREPADVSAAVHEHVRTDEHQRWRESRRW